GRAAAPHAAYSAVNPHFLGAGYFQPPKALFSAFLFAASASGNVIASPASMSCTPHISSSAAACRRRQAGSFLNEEFS
ncbi:hypothetical protein, partial [Serratia marcescens]|uniref:hypothetical protein n=1 Tax=Serratia marcescens TaxID=615 RepID=UPI001960E440